MSNDKWVMTEDQKKWIDWMLHGMGISAARSSVKPSEKRELDELVERGMAYKGKNHSGDKVGMYYIPNKERERISKLLSPKQ